MSTLEPICEHTSVRTTCCACSSCGGSDAAAKFNANHRDAKALLGLIAGALENHAHFTTEGQKNWADVGTMARLRNAMKDIAIGMAAGDDPGLCIEDALGAPDDEVDAALIEAI